MQKLKYIPVFFLFLFLLGCDQQNNFDVIPSISFKGVSKTQVNQGRLTNDSLYISISFKDGDGDLGSENNLANIFLEDSRDGFVTAFSSPVVPASGAENGIEGTITILLNTLFNVCCYFPNGQDPCSESTDFPQDTVYYRITLEDRAGHLSNEVETSPIIILCN